MIVRPHYVRPSQVRPIKQGAKLPSSLLRGLVWAPDMIGLDDLYSGRSGVPDGTTLLGNTRARLFNGTTDRIDFANVRDFGTTPRAHSGAMWLRPTSVAAGLAVIWTDSLGSGGPSQSVIFRRSTAALEFSHAYSTTSLQRVSAADVLAVNTWHHVAWTYDGSATAAGAAIYVNGAVVGSYQTTTNPVGTARGGDGIWALGGRVEADTNCFAGQIQSPMVWDRVLLASEVATLYRVPRLV